MLSCNYNKIHTKIQDPNTESKPRWDFSFVHIAIQEFIQCSYNHNTSNQIKEARGKDFGISFCCMEKQCIDHPSKLVFLKRKAMKSH